MLYSVTYNARLQKSRHWDTLLLVILLHITTAEQDIFFAKHLCLHVVTMQG